MIERNQECWYKDVCKFPSCASCVRFNEVKFLMEAANVPIALRRPIPLYPYTPEDTKSFQQLDLIKKDIKSFVDTGDNLYICSNYAGTGKTSWAIKLLLKYFDVIWPENSRDTRALFVHVPTLMTKLKDFANTNVDEYRQQIIDVDLVVWDDIATADKLSSYEYSQLLMLLDARLNAGRANIYTSNITSLDDLSSKLGARLASRIYNLSLIIEFTAIDNRQRH